MGKRKRRGAVRWREEIGKYVIDFYDNLGKRHIETIGTNWRTANDKLDEKMNEVRTGVFTSLKGKEIFKEYALRWIKGKVSIKHLTKVAYEGIIDNHLIPYFGDARIADLKRNNIQDFVKTKIAELRPSPKTISNILLVLRQILNDAEVDGVLARNPYLKIERPKIEKTEKDYLRTDEIKIFLEKCKGQDYALFYTAIFSGMRRGELLGLQWGDIDWINQKIHVRRSLYRGGFQSPKSEYSKRAIDMGPRLAQVLKEQRARQSEVRLKAGKNWTDNDLAFCQKDGTPLDGDNIYHRDFRNILKESKLRRIRIHDLRHTFASILIAAGHNPKYIQSQLGHASIIITMDLYGHLMPEVHKGAAEKSEDFVFGNVAVTYKEKGATANV